VLRRSYDYKIRLLVFAVNRLEDRACETLLNRAIAYYSENKVREVPRRKDKFDVSIQTLARVNPDPEDGGFYGMSKQGA